MGSKMKLPTQPTEPSSDGPSPLTSNAASPDKTENAPEVTPMESSDVKPADSCDVLSLNVLTDDQVTEILNAASTGDVDEVEKCLVPILGLSDLEHCLIPGILLDYYVAAVWWAAREQSFTPQQFAAFFAVVHTLFINIKDKGCTVAENMIELKKMAVGIEPDKPDNGTPSGLAELFNVDEMKLITDYINISLFQHHKLYEFLVDCHQFAYSCVDKSLTVWLPASHDPLVPPPLCESISEEVSCLHYNRELYQLEDVETPAAAAKMSPEDELMSKLPPDVICKTIDSVFAEMIQEFQGEFKTAVNASGHSMVERINKIRVVKPK